MVCVLIRDARDVPNLFPIMFEICFWTFEFSFLFIIFCFERAEASTVEAEEEEEEEELVLEEESAEESRRKPGVVQESEIRPWDWIWSSM